MWQPIETLPMDQWVIGRRPAGNWSPAFVGKTTKVFGNRPGYLINEWTGAGAVCDAWMPVPEPNHE